MEPRHRLEQRGELVAVAFIEKRRKLVEGVGRDLLECVGGHGVLLWTGCPWFLRALRNPTTRLEDTRLRHRRAEHRGGSHRACQRSVLARREAAGERCGVIVRSTTACRWRSHLADDKRMTDTFENVTDDGSHSSSGLAGVDVRQTVELQASTFGRSIVAPVRPPRHATLVFIRQHPKRILVDPPKQGQDLILRTADAKRTLATRRNTLSGGDSADRPAAFPGPRMFTSCAAY